MPKYNRKELSTKLKAVQKATGLKGGKSPMNQQFIRQVQAIVDNIRRVIVADPDVIEMSLLGLLCQGHILLDGAAGVGKTLLAKALAQSIQAKFKRVQFTPDLLPTDITGSSIYDPTRGDFRCVPGPIFANVVLAHEINRSSPGTQSALLGAMNEGYVTLDGVAYSLPTPFFVVATRNITEKHGTFPLSQDQLDRFLLSFGIGYPEPKEEVKILELYEHGVPTLGPVLTVDEVSVMQAKVQSVEVAHQTKEYIASIVAETRSSPEIATEVSPRGAAFLQVSAQARAAMEGRDFATPDDVKTVAPAVLRHRILAHSSELNSSAKYIEGLLDTIPTPPLGK